MKTVDKKTRVVTKMTYYKKQVIMVKSSQWNKNCNQREARNDLP